MRRFILLVIAVVLMSVGVAIADVVLDSFEDTYAVAEGEDVPRVAREIELSVQNLSLTFFADVPSGFSETFVTVVGDKNGPAWLSIFIADDLSTILLPHPETLSKYSHKQIADHFISLQGSVATTPTLYDGHYSLWSGTYMAEVVIGPLSGDTATSTQGNPTSVVCSPGGVTTPGVLVVTPAPDTGTCIATAGAISVGRSGLIVAAASRHLPLCMDRKLYGDRSMRL